MHHDFTAARHLPRHIWAGLLLYTVASLTHFIHNAEYLAYYPNMPAWVTRETVYLVWLAGAAVGAAGVALSLLRWRIVAGACLAVYGALGLDGLGHYSLALCSEHTWAMNATIWFEVVAGTVFALACIRFVRQQILARRGRTTADRGD